MQQGQALVARARVIVAVLLQVPEELEHPVECQIRDRQLRDPAVRGIGDEAEEQLDAVAIATHRRRSEPLHCDETVEEERLHDRADRLRRHGATPLSTGAANPSKRRFAAVSSSDVIVR